MALARARRGEGGLNYWPGFVDALSTLILSIIFILTVFVVVQFYLQQEVAGKDTALTRLNAQVAELTELLSMEKEGKASVEDQLAQLRASLAGVESDRDKYKNLADTAASERDKYKSLADTAASESDKFKALAGAATSERDKLKGLADSAAAATGQAQSRNSELSSQVENQKKISANALAQVEILNQQIAALRRQLAVIEQTLNASEAKNKESQTRIADLGQRLNLALAQKVQELTKYRSDFFGKLREILGNRPDVRVVGDRFVLQSEVFFDTNKADLLPAAASELDKTAAALTDLEKQIPADIPWVLRVDGHTDARPITGGAFKSNWDLSAARAVAVVKYLISKGVPPQRLVAAGFGEFQPIDTGTTDDAYKRNRRIEFKLTER